MTKYEKFILQNLSKHSVVNQGIDNNTTCDQDALIDNVITEHLKTIITDTNITDTNAGDTKQSDKQAQDDAQATIDLEAIKLASYNKGLADAKADYDNIINELQIDNNLATLLEEKLSQISANLDLDTQVATLTAQIIANLARKIYLILPTDFEQVLRLELLKPLRQIYKEGQIKLTVHPQRYDFCNNILQTQNLSAKFKENIHIIKDDSISINDCRLQWFNTCLEYSQEQISFEIEKILTQIKTLA